MESWLFLTSVGLLSFRETGLEAQQGRKHMLQLKNQSTVAEVVVYSQERCAVLFLSQEGQAILCLSSCGFTIGKLMQIKANLYFLLDGLPDRKGTKTPVSTPGEHRDTPAASLGFRYSLGTQSILPMEVLERIWWQLRGEE